MKNENPEQYTLRIRFRIPGGNGLDIEKPEYTISIPSISNDVVLQAYGHSDPNRKETIKEAEWLLIVIRNLETKEYAGSLAEAILDALRRATAYTFIGADVGNRAAGGSFTKAGLALFEKEAGQRHLNDIHGPMVYPTGIKAKLIKTSPVTITQHVPEQRWSDTLCRAINEAKKLSERERTAFDMFSGAIQVADQQDARFALLFAAVECLIEVKKKSQQEIEHINKLIEMTKEANLEESQKEALIGTLGYAQKDSIKSAGRRLIEVRLGDQLIGQESALDLFDACYKMRNRLLHGRQPFPSRDEVARLAAPLEVMVGKLIANFKEK